MLKGLCGQKLRPLLILYLVERSPDVPASDVPRRQPTPLLTMLPVLLSLDLYFAGLAKVRVWSRHLADPVDVLHVQLIVAAFWNRLDSAILGSVLHSAVQRPICYMLVKPETHASAGQGLRAQPFRDGVL